jgi:hypothetical protein
MPRNHVEGHEARDVVEDRRVTRHRVAVELEPPRQARRKASTAAGDETAEPRGREREGQAREGSGEVAAALYASPPRRRRQQTQRNEEHREPRRCEDPTRLCEHAIRIQGSPAEVRERSAEREPGEEAQRMLALRLAPLKQRKRDPERRREKDELDLASRHARTA